MTLPAHPARHELLERTAALVPLLRRNAAAAETARRMPLENLDALAEAGVFRMAAPLRYGGHEADFQTQCDVLAEVARGCASSSWVATIFSAMAWLVATFPDDAQEELLGDGDPRISGVFSPSGTLTPVDGGVVANGRWGFNTGGTGSRWTVLNAVLGGSDAGAGVPTCVIVPSAELRMLDDWHASGMAATGSHTVVAEDVFVPARRTQPLPLMIDARYVERRHNAAHPFFNYPLAAVLTVNAGGTPVGIARAAVDEFLARVPGRPITYTTYTDKAEAPITHLQAGEAAMLADSAAAHVRAACELLDRHRGTPLSVRQRVQARAHIAYATGEARRAVDVIFHGSGASAIQSHVPIQRLQRDMQALANHAIMHAPTGLELYGRVLCGLPPNTMLY